MMRAFRISVVGFFGAFVIGIVAYASLRVGFSALFGKDISPFAAPPRMFLYHWKYWYQYLAIVALVYGLLLPLWVNFHSHSGKAAYWAGLTGFLASTILLASIPGGVLWQIHDMMAGFCPHESMIVRKIWRGAVDGLLLGWWIVTLSFPLNLITFIFSAALTHKITTLETEREKRV
jgi:hypothetical protein